MKASSVLILSAALTGCMYPGVDAGSYRPMGESLAMVEQAQIAYPEQQYGSSHIVESVDGDRAKAAYDKMQTSAKATDSAGVAKDIRISVGK